MSKLIYFIFIIIFTFASCDGRDRGHKTNSEILKENKLLDSFSENRNYFPKTYSEKVTDTILKNGLNVKIKHFSDANKGITDTIQLDSIKYINTHRDFNASVSVSFNQNNVFYKTYNKEHFIKNDKPNKSFVKKAIMCFVEVNQLESQNQDYAVIDFVLCKPETDDCLTYKLKVNKEGNYVIERSNESYYKEI